MTIDVVSNARHIDLYGDVSMIPSASIMPNELGSNRTRE